jgi:hypothetical protein
MGLFDFFKHRPASPQKPAVPLQNSAQPRARGGGPSVGYVFAHDALPSVAFQNPAGFLFALSEGSPNRQQVLKDLWKQASRNVPGASESAPPDFALHPFVLCQYCGMWIELPAPEKETEAYMVAFLARLPERDDPKSKPIPASYFTLEKGGELEAMLAQAQGIPESYDSRVISALRRNPRLLLELLRETPFRITFFKDLEGQVFPALKSTGLLEGSLKRHFFPSPIFESLVDDKSAFADFLHEFEKVMTPTRTVLGGWSPERNHMNYGDGPRIERNAFLSDIAVLMLAQQ